ncbi:dipeptide/oligopeptide/nickel ABC transporter permease/ATP-binding protein [Microbacterium sp.]|uniref:dipeptide/oligopeptide/nickel ABC transporter permease/ATP-binding protein n=1 Tax=Microbacterium sp. TaxID=51671 RepID=UPI00333F6D7C
MTDVIDTPLAAPAAARRGFAGRLLRHPVGVVSLAVILISVLASLLAGVISPYDPLHQDLADVMGMPSAAHPLGTDTLGRDVLSRILHGGQSALWGVVVAVLVWLVVGVLLGIVAGYLGGWTDRVISAIVDIVMSLPSIVIILAVLAMFSRSLPASMIALGLLSAGGLVRVVRAATLGIRGELYVTAARVAGLGDVRILGRHILPGLIGPVVVQLALFAGAALTIQAGLGFLDLGVPPPAPSWGGMIGEAAQVIDQFPWLLVPSGGIVAILILALGLLGDASRDIIADSRKASARGGGRSRRRAGAGALPVDAPEAALSITDLSVRFGGAAAVSVDGVSLTVARGEIVGLVGESGSGKTVTALALLGLLPGQAEVVASRLQVGGRDLLGASDRELAKIRGSEIAYVSQEPMVSLDPSFTVGSLLGEVIRRHHRGLSSSAVRDRSLDLLRRVHLPEPEALLRRYAFQLSGGMAQRVVIALALAGQPKALIADEPTTALDVTVQAEILDLLRELRDERGLAIVLVTHDLGVVADICDRVCVMRSGRIVEDAPAEELFAAPRHDYTRRLLAATPDFQTVRASAPGEGA